MNCLKTNCGFEETDYFFEIYQNVIFHVHLSLHFVDIIGIFSKYEIKE